MKRVLLFLMLFLLASACWAQMAMPPGLRDSEDPMNSDKSWEYFAEASGLSPEEITKLRDNRILVTNKSYKQIYEPYIDLTNPYFITSDSLLNAYHVLFEESIYCFENRMATELRFVLQALMDDLPDAKPNIDVPDELVEKARIRALLVVGVALKLMDDSFRFQDESLERLMNVEIDRIERASDVLKPGWLGKPDEDFLFLDYSRFKPRGFYTNSKHLQGYFRALSWLQAIPFHLASDQEIMSFLLITHASTELHSVGRRKRRFAKACFRTYLTAYTDLLKRKDCPDLDDFQLSYLREVGWQPNKLLQLEQFKKNLSKELSRRDKKSQVNDHVSLAHKDESLVAKPGFRVISAFRLPDSALFQATTDLRHFDRPFPTGLEVATVLGSRLAKEQLEVGNDDSLSAVIQKKARIFEDDSLYCRYLSVLRELVNDPEPDAPDFLKSRGWQTKSCNTLLAAWAQMRHTWQLQAKSGMTYMCMNFVPSGFVEPDPQFFQQLGVLALHTKRLLRKVKAFEPGWLPIEHKNTGDEMELSFEDTNFDLEVLWEDLESVCHRLESIAHKQLRGVVLSDSDEAFIKGYGERIAHLMLYNSNSFHNPRDDTPRVVDVFSNAELGMHMEVGVARAHQIYVLYPWKDDYLLCEGAVLPYYEFRSKSRLTDGEWKILLDSAERPDIPDWFKPIVAGGKLDSSRLGER